MYILIEATSVGGVFLGKLPVHGGYETLNCFLQRFFHVNKLSADFRQAGIMAMIYETDLQFTRDPFSIRYLESTLLDQAAVL